MSFNLLSEILFVQAMHQPRRRQSPAGFNLLSEILFVQASPFPHPPAGTSRFQSLERDSVCSSKLYVTFRDAMLASFNLLSEILFVQA